jgi:hypothetical protein
MKLLKPIELSFEFYGSERAGIYKLVNNEWQYQYTMVSDGKLSTTIPAGTFIGGEYGIFIDNNYKIIPDISFSWAQKEITTLMRREDVIGGQNFYPNAKVTRAQVADLFYRVLNANPVSSKPSIKDVLTNNTYKNAIDFMVSKKYMNIDSLGNFNPNSTVSYIDFETIVSRIQFTSVDWKFISDKMLYERFTKSSGATNQSLPMNKAEAVYGIYEFFR